MKGVLPWLVRWARRAGTVDFCLALAALVRPVKNSIFLTANLLTFLGPIAQKPGHRGRQSCWVASLCVSCNNLVRLSITHSMPHVL
jgi:hypothetical protein